MSKYTFVIALDYATQKRVPCRTKTRDAKRDGFETYDTREQCEAAINFGLNASDKKTKMKWSETHYYVEFTKNREYRVECVSFADSADEAIQIVKECWDVKARAIKGVQSKIVQFDYLEMYPRLFAKPVHSIPEND